MDVSIAMGGGERGEGGGREEGGRERGGGHQLYLLGPLDKEDLGPAILSAKRSINDHPF